MELLKNPHTLETEALLSLLKTNAHVGLQQDDIDRRRLQFGPNIIHIRKSVSTIIILLRQFASPLVWVLVFAAVLAFLFQEWLEGIAVIIVIIVNAVIGFIMESQAIRSMEALRRLVKSQTRVFRNAEIQIIDAENLVPGDIIYLEAGDQVPADGRLIELHNLAISEAALTGESIPVSKITSVLDKNVPPADQKNLVFRGTSVSRGNGTAVVVFTGDNTELGKIAKLTEEAHKDTTPLEVKLIKLSKKLIGLSIILAFLVLVIGVLQGRGLYLMIETAIALAIAAIPEGLPIVATIALANGMLRLAKKNTIVKKLSAVETLGETDIIFTDKTGTLTENQLLPDILVFPPDQFEIKLSSNSSETFSSKLNSNTHDQVLRQMMRISLLCNNASIENPNGEEGIGDPLEVALLKFVKSTGINIEQEKTLYPRIHEIPFDSHTKMMGTLHKNGTSSSFLVCIKGAIEVVLNESDYVMATGGGKIPLNTASKEPWLRKADKLAANGLRVLSFAYSKIDEPKEDFFQHLVFVGLIGFIDPPRKEIRDSLHICQEAGLRVIMATGDHPGTAQNIAYRIGLTDNDLVVQGSELQLKDKMNEKEQHRLKECNVFARVSPEQKLKLVKFWQSQGKTVAMTGDGVNDTPALKKADIGIAMGIRGTEAAKQVADLVLKDDAFTSIVLAIKQGRGIFENIRHFVVYLLSCNLSELLLVASAFFTNLTLPLLPLQILFINMVTDVFPAFALGMNRESEKVMKQPPRKKNIPFLTRPIWIAIVFYAIAITIACLGALIFASQYLGTSDIVANNFAFYTLILAQLWNVFNLPESNKSFFSNEVTRNKYVWLAIGTSILIIVLAYSIDVVKDVLKMADFNLEYLGYVFIFSLFPVLLIQIFKRFDLIR